MIRCLGYVGFAVSDLDAWTTFVPITATPGRHTNDPMVSFYARTSPGFEVEFGCGARTIDDAVWRTARHDEPSSWGQKRPARR